MCLSTVQYDGKVGYGFKAGPKSGLKLNHSLDDRVRVHRNTWYQCNEIQIYTDDDDKAYNTGFHIFTQADHAHQYALWNWSLESLNEDDMTIYLVEYKDIMYIGQQTIGEYTSYRWKEAPCIIARHMRAVAEYTGVKSKYESHYEFQYYEGHEKQNQAEYFI